MIDISIEKSRHIEKIIMLSMDNSRNTQMEKFEKLQKKNHFYETFFFMHL
jgi:hypothetical protein